MKRINSLPFPPVVRYYVQLYYVRLICYAQVLQITATLNSSQEATPTPFHSMQKFFWFTYNYM